MKFSTSILFVLTLLAFSSCKKQEPQAGDLPVCIQEKMEAFKQLPSAESIIKILKPSGELYWFVDSHGDGVESVFDLNCALVCITDCECTGNFVCCDDTHFDFPWETIWHK